MPEFPFDLDYRWNFVCFLEYGFYKILIGKSSEWIMIQRSVKPTLYLQLDVLYIGISSRPINTYRSNELIDFWWLVIWGAFLLLLFLNIVHLTTNTFSYRSYRCYIKFDNEQRFGLKAENHFRSWYLFCYDRNIFPSDKINIFRYHDNNLIYIIGNFFI